MSSPQKPWEFDNPLCAEIGTVPYYLNDKDEEPQLPDHIVEYRKAQQLCGSCKHQFDCAEWGIKNERYGVWGGLTPDQRAAIRTRRNIFISEELSRI